MRILSIPLYRQPERRLWMVFTLLGALLLGTFQTQTPVHADAGYAYYWSLTFDFESNIDGLLFVAVGYNDNGAPQEPPLYTQTSTVPCKRKGNATVSGGVLELNGGYLSCDLDIYSALARAFSACGAKVPGCSLQIEKYEPYANFRAETTVRSTNPGDAPIFYHQDASYTINPQSSTTQITASLSPHGVIPSTPMFSLPALNVWQDYSALYTCAGACQMQYSAAGGLEIVPTLDAKLPFYTAASTIFIGHNPNTGVTAPAGTEIDFLFVDPPNHGND